MASSNTLSHGVIDKILKTSDCTLSPVVQVLGSKQMNGNRVRAVISDGATLYQNFIFTTNDATPDQGPFTKYSIFRLDKYNVSSMPNKQTNAPQVLIIVSQISVLKLGISFALVDDNDAISKNFVFIYLGNEVGKKLEAGESFVSGGSVASSSFLPPLTPSTSGASRPSISPRVNQMSNTRFDIDPDLVADRSFNTEKVCPLICVTPFFNSWVFRVRVTSKTPMKIYNNAKNSGKLFSFDVIDDSGEMRITAFNQEADRFYDILETGKLYFISKGSVKQANKKFSSLNSDYEITLNSNSIIKLIDESEASKCSIPKMRYKFVQLALLEKKAVSDIVDVIGVVRSLSEQTTLISKRTNKELVKREFSLVDSTLAEVRVTVWNDATYNFPAETAIGDIIALKGVMVSEFKGKTLSTTSHTVITLDPPVPETAIVRSWYASNVTEETIFNPLSAVYDVSSRNRDLSDYRTVSQLTLDLVVAKTAPNTAGNPMNQLYSSIYGSIIYINTSSAMYKACSTPDCQKKVTEGGDNVAEYYCAKCDKTARDFKWRLMLSIIFADATGNSWLTIFHENAERMTGYTVSELANIYERDESEFVGIINRTIKWSNNLLRLGSKVETYINNKDNMETQRVRSSVYSAASRSTGYTAIERSRLLLTAISKMNDQLEPIATVKTEQF